MSTGGKITENRNFKNILSIGYEFEMPLLSKFINIDDDVFKQIGEPVKNTKDKLVKDVKDGFKWLDKKVPRSNDDFDKHAKK